LIRSRDGGTGDDSAAGIGNASGESAAGGLCGRFVNERIGEEQQKEDAEIQYLDEAGHEALLEKPR
jgi:hypothetical protein